MLLRDNVYDSLRADILMCRLAPGDDMREQELAERYAVSRQPVREALARLEREHLVRAIASIRSRFPMRAICCGFALRSNLPVSRKQSSKRPMRRCGRWMNFENSTAPEKRSLNITAPFIPRWQRPQGIGAWPPQRAI